MEGRGNVWRGFGPITSCPRQFPSPHWRAATQANYVLPVNMSLRTTYHLCWRGRLENFMYEIT